MKILLFFFTNCLFLTVVSHANLPENPIEYSTWEKRLLEAVKLQAGQPPEVAIPKLGRWVNQLSSGANIEAGERPVFYAAQSALLSVPGHAKYYQDYIESLRTKALENAKKSPEELSRLHDAGGLIEGGDYEDFRSEAFPILGLLPSSESVAVLGHFLNDREGLDGNNMFGHRIAKSDFVPFPANAGAAAIALRKLRIEHPPFPVPPYAGDYDYEAAEVDAWKDWWNQVKDGKRTYRFIGSPIEYGPDGPASAEAIQRAQRNMKRDAERSSGHKKATSVTEPASVITHISKPSSIAAILVACALVAATVWYFMRGRRAT